MKNIDLIFTTCILLIFTIACEKTEDKFDFNNSTDRIGNWINSEKHDTLVFKDNTNLIRKGQYYSYEEYIYRLSGDTMFIKLPNTTIETKHQILKKDSKSITLSNMYITIGFNDNSGIFIKQ